MPHVSTDYKFIFVHVPKCGGNSIKEAFNLKGHNHSKITPEYVNENYSNYFKFTFVRNPWDRVVSAFKYLKDVSTLDAYHRDFINTRYPQFEDFIKSKEWTEWLHFLPQHQFISIDSKICVDFIGKVETMQSDFNIICKTLGVKPKTLSKINATNRNNYTEYFDDETRQIIADVYAKDIELFEYKYGTLI